MRILSLYASWKLVELAECRMCIWAATCPRNGRLVVKWPLKMGRLFVRGDAPGPSFFPTRTPGRPLTAAFNALLALIALAPCLQRHIFHPRPSLPWTDLQCQDIPPPSGVPSLRQIEMQLRVRHPKSRVQPSLTPPTRGGHDERAYVHVLRGHNVRFRHQKHLLHVPFGSSVALEPVTGPPRNPYVYRPPPPNPSRRQTQESRDKVGVAPGAILLTQSIRPKLERRIQGRSPVAGQPITARCAWHRHPLAG